MRLADLNVGSLIGLRGFDHVMETGSHWTLILLSFRRPLLPAWLGMIELPPKPSAKSTSGRNIPEEFHPATKALFLPNNSTWRLVPMSGDNDRSKDAQSQLANAAYRD
jgi:hypothetical protein